jgi:hypothetical protein
MQDLAKKFIFSTLKTLGALFALMLAVYFIRPAQAITIPSTIAIAEYEVLHAPEVVEEVVPEVTQEPAPVIVQDVLLEVCRARGYDVACAKTLLGMLWKESLGVSKAVGDRGKARGWYQIWVKLHKISLECAEDLRCSSDWTISYLESNSYPRYVAYAVQCHNGCNAGNGYAASTRRHGERLWSTPLIINGDGNATLNTLAAK